MESFQTRKSRQEVIAGSLNSHSRSPLTIRYSLFALTFISRPLPARGLLVPRQAVARTFPRREEIEIAEFLGEAHLLVHDALLLVVVADLHEPGERKILAQRMALEAVVGEQPAHVRMAGEDDTVEIVGLALEPVGAGKDADDGSDRRLLVDLELHPDAQVQLGREQMVDDVEAALAPGPVDRRDVEQAQELAALVVAQEGRELHNVARDRMNRQLAVRHRVARDRARQRAGDGLAKFVERFIHGVKSISARSCRYGGSFSAAT